MPGLRFAYAGDREIAVRVLDFLLAEGARPLCLLVPAPDKQSHADALASRCPFLPADRVLRGADFQQPHALELLRCLELDYVFGVHFPLIVPSGVLAIPRRGMLNLHPAYLPYNRGWHTPSWALLDETPIGATLHFMDSGVDTGDIVHQRELAVSPADTAHSLYQRLLDLELQVFREAWPGLVADRYPRRRQDPGAGSVHKRRDLLAERIRRVDLDEQVRAGDLIRRLRALTTNRADEAGYYEANGRRYRIRVSIEEEGS
jgi:methionyl-tRNA formyltransferase